MDIKTAKGKVEVVKDGKKYRFNSIAEMEAKFGKQKPSVSASKAEKAPVKAKAAPKKKTPAKAPVAPKKALPAKVAVKVKPVAKKKK